MRRLPEAVKRRIVEHLACYWSHSEVADMIMHEYGVHVTPRHVRTYDPTSFQCTASERLRDLHAATRKRFEQEVAEVPIARRAFRLRRLQKIHDQALASGNLTLALHTLEQAAKEVGGTFTNARVAVRKTL